MDVLSCWFILVGVFFSSINGFVIDGNVSVAEYGIPLYNTVSGSTTDWFVTNNDTYIVVAVKTSTVYTDGILAVAFYMNPSPPDQVPADGNTTWADVAEIMTFPFPANRFFLAKKSQNNTLQYTFTTEWVPTTCTYCQVAFGNNQVEIAIPWVVFSDLRNVNGLQFWGRFIQGSTISTSAEQEYGLPLSENTIISTSPQFYYDTYPYVRLASGSWNDSYWSTGVPPLNSSTEYTRSCVVVAPGVHLSLPDQVHITSLAFSTPSSLELEPGAVLTVGARSGNFTSIVYLPDETTIYAPEATLKIAAPSAIGDPTNSTGNVTVSKLIFTTFGSSLIKPSIYGYVTINVLDELYVEEAVTNFLPISYSSNDTVLRYDTSTATANVANTEWGDNEENYDYIPGKVIIEDIAQISKTASGTGTLVRSDLEVKGILTLSCSGQVPSLRIPNILNITGNLTLNCDLAVDGDITVAEDADVQCQNHFLTRGNTPFYGLDSAQWENGTVHNLMPGDYLPVGNDGITVNFSSAVVVQGWTIDSETVQCLNQQGCVFSVGNRFGRNISVSLTAGPNQDCPATFTFYLYDATVNKDKGLSGGAIAGITVGVVAGVAALASIAGAVFYLRRRNEPLYDSDSQTELADVRTSVESVGSVSSTSKFNARKTLREEWEIPYSQLTLGKELGRGAFGIVYKCRWRNTDCVVKQLEINKNDQQSIKQFLREANHVQNLRSHPNVCTVFGVCTNPEFPICIVMEFVPEGSLDALVYQRKIVPDAKMVLELAKDIASGMSHLHAESVLHCDLACRNLLVISRGNNKYQVKIADFGLSRVTDTDTYNASTTKTFPVRWTAPETLQSGKISRASDVWSFGIVLWEIVEGKRPYTDMSNAEIIKAVCDKGYRLPKPDRIPIPETLYTLMKDCWHEDPSLRPTFDTICKKIDAMLQTLFVFAEEDHGVNLPTKKDDDTYNNYNNNNSNSTEQVVLPGQDNYN